MPKAGLLELKRRIKTINSTIKITKAVAFASSSKFKKAKSNLDTSMEYFNKFEEFLNVVLPSIELPSYSGDLSLYIIITSDTGLCGSYNVNVIKSAIEDMKNKRVLLITIGEIGRAFFKLKGYETTAEYVESGINPSSKDIEEIAEKIVNQLRNGVFEVNIVYTKFYSPLKQIVQITRLIPLDTEEKKEYGYIEFEPSLEDVKDELIQMYLRNKILSAVLQSAASEYAIRMRTMDSAAKNASEMLDDLNLLYNRIRQSSITQEITEIVSGAEAMRD